MKVLEAIEQVRNLKPNQYDDATLLRWLSDLDGQLWQDLICHYGEKGAPAPAAYTLDDADRQLLAERPHDDLYVTYLSAKIDYQNGEYDRYNNSMMIFTAQRQAYYDAYNRTHMPRQDNYIRI